MPLLVVSATRLLFQIKHLDGVLLLNHFIKLIERLIHIKEWIAILHRFLLLPLLRVRVQSADDRLRSHGAHLN